MNTGLLTDLRPPSEGKVDGDSVASVSPLRGPLRPPTARQVNLVASGAWTPGSGSRCRVPAAIETGYRRRQRLFLQVEAHKLGQSGRHGGQHRQVVAHRLQPGPMVFTETCDAPAAAQPLDMLGGSAQELFNISR
jgi:hypothetical protein